MPLPCAAVDWKQTPNRRERVIFFATLIVFSLGFLKSCWFPSRRAITEVQKNLIALKATAVVSPLHNPVAGVQGDLSDTMRKLSSPSVLHGIQLTGSTFSDLEHENGVARQHVELTMVGSFANLGRYIETLEAARAPLVINELTLSGSPGDWTKVTAEIKGSLYGVAE